MFKVRDKVEVQRYTSKYDGRRGKIIGKPPPTQLSPSSLHRVELVDGEILMLWDCEMLLVCPECNMAGVHKMDCGSQ